MAKMGRMGIGKAAAAAFALAWMGTCAPSAALAAKRAGPQVVVHPLTPEERLQEADYVAYDPLMADMGPYSTIDPAKIDARAKQLIEQGSKTDSPFVDWAHAAALALSSLDPASDAAKEAASRWGSDWTLLRRAANERFSANEAGRAATIADNSLCAYRADQEAKLACESASAIRAKEASSALGMDWPRWVEQTAAGLAQSAGWPAKWPQRRAEILAEADGQGKAGEIESKIVKLQAWSATLSPPVARAPVDALALARAWAKESCWRAASPSPGAWPCGAGPWLLGEAASPPALR